MRCGSGQTPLRAYTVNKNGNCRTAGNSGIKLTHARSRPMPIVAGTSSLRQLSVVLRAASSDPPQMPASRATDNVLVRVYEKPNSAAPGLLIVRTSSVDRK